MKNSSNKKVAAVAMCAAISLTPRWTAALADEASRPGGDRYIPTLMELQQGYERSQPANRPRPQLYKAQIAPHWFGDDTRFWYRNDLRSGSREFIAVDAERGVRQPAFDRAKLASALSKAAGKEYWADRLPFESIEFLQD